MKKNKVLIISFITILIICILLGFLLNKKPSNNKNLSKDLYNNKYIKDIRKDKKNLIIVINETKDNCLEQCMVTKDNLKIMEDVYNLDYKVIERDKTKDDYNTFIKEYNIDESIINYPTLFVIENGEIKYTTTALIFSDLKKNLKEYKLIDYNDDYAINYDDFIRLFESKDKSLIFLNYNDVVSEKIINNLYNLSKQYNFKYSSCVFGLAGSLPISNILIEQVGEDFRIPILIVVKDKKIVDFTYATSSDEIKMFLVKNKYIK
ncbi:MAG: hypothetical protein VZS44_02890 [Bacilli bacterium]|nr:hypothetical protein [Bacilli bacterium]